MNRLTAIFRNRVDTFLLLAFLPLLFIGYYRYAFFDDALGVFVPLYGFLLLLMKKDQLSECTSGLTNLQRLFGIAVILGSFFIYYVIVPFIPWVGFYGIINYTVYLLGLFLVFFTISALKQAFTTFFLIVATGLIGLSFRWIETMIAPTVPYYVSFFSSVIGALGIEHILPSPTQIYMRTPNGNLLVGFAAGCIGVYSLLIFSILIVVTMVETSASKRTKLAWSLIGLIGVFVLNVIRLLIVVLSMYFYGWNTGQRVHQVIGYILFLSWLAVFLLLFSKRQTIAGKVRLVREKISP
ncbi:MAG: exosortase/archaeosortase family protein [Candidatus Bathyarchaeota archaeon]